MSTLRVAAFTQGAQVPSARFRVRQYLPALRALGCEVEEHPARYGSYPPESFWLRPPWLAASLAERSLALMRAWSDVVLLQREMISTLAAPTALSRSPLVFDVDDAIWLTQRRGAIDTIARRSRAVLCGNAYIAEYFGPLAPVRILPTGVDAARWSPGAADAQPTLVWSGSASGLEYLRAITPALRATLEAVEDVRVRVVCNAPPVLDLPPDRVQWVPWSREAEVGAIQSATVGLMPMPDTPWTRGKCSFKLLTYLACGVPGVASPFGMNADVIKGGGALGAASAAQWTDALVHLLRERDAAQALGRAGRAQVEARYAVSVLAPQLAAHLREAAA
ncbi:glycosyltransferase [Niveibacterium sp. SC-1]|uniref:glycosyltransferase n=1 Tax=Niveibacterium sp. SC-1 TaxID=3135646 RepID=UPI00311FAB69